MVEVAGVEIREGDSTNADFQRCRVKVGKHRFSGFALERTEANQIEGLSRTKLGQTERRGGRARNRPVARSETDSAGEVVFCKTLRYG